MSFVLAFLGFAALIILHEAGHFVAAKAVGMRVERFSLFFRPLIWKFRRGETEYGIGAIPLGGYVKITGMNPDEDIPPEVVPRAYYNQPVWKRVVTILAGPLVNLRDRLRDHRDAVPRPGAAGGPQRPDPVQLAGVDAVGAPASRALRAGDTIVGVDGRRGLTANADHQADRLAPLRRHAHQRLPAAHAGARSLIRRAGRVSLDRRLPALRRAPPRRCASGSASARRPTDVGPAHGGLGQPDDMGSVTSKTVSTIVQIFQPKDRKPGPRRGRQLHGHREIVLHAAPRQALWVLALISLSLAVINLFPFLPLDGGHVFWARGREGSRAAHPVRGDGAGRSRRLRPRRRPLRDRAEQRHHDSQRAGYQVR